MIKHPRYDSDYYHAEINKMLICGTPENGFAVRQCLHCGKGEHTVNFSCKGKGCLQCGKRYARDSMTKIAARLFPGVSYRQGRPTIVGSFIRTIASNPKHIAK